MRSVLLRTLLVSLPLVSFSLVAQEAGKYERKSVTYINALWLMDQSTKNLSSDNVGMILQKVKDGITMKRFDYNPVPESFITDFTNQANALVFPETAAKPSMMSGLSSGSDPMIDSIAAVMERTVVPKILEVVDAAKEMRASNLTTEQQRNSFISDKAKMLGITMEDIDKVMNSAYIFIPLARRSLSVLNDSAYNASLELGIIMFRISSVDGKSKALPVVRKFTFSQGNSKLGKSYATSDGLISYQEFAFRSAIKNAVRNLVVSVQEVPEFRLSGQVVEKSLGSVGFDIGKNEGVKLDDKYHFVEYIEAADGKITQKNNGWLMVSSVGDSAKKQGYKSKGAIISGMPFVGAVLSEYPRIPLDVTLGYQMVDITQTLEDSLTKFFKGLKLSPAIVGAKLEVAYNVGQNVGIRQFFLGIGAGIGMGDVKGMLIPSSKNSIDSLDQKEIANLTIITADISLTKKIYLRRLVLGLSAGVGYDVISLYTKSNLNSTDSLYRVDNTGLGGLFGGSVEFALSPALNFGVAAQYRLYLPNQEWTIQSRETIADKWANYGDGKMNDNVDATINHSGLNYRVFLTWSPPGLPFDPVDMIRGNSGL